MTNIVAILANVPVADLDSAVPFYQAITGTQEVHRFEFGELRVARVGSFLLIEGPLSGWSAEQNATIVVKSVDDVVSAIGGVGGVVLDGPHEVPNGARVMVRHPDGVVFEYLQPRSA